MFFKIYELADSLVMDGAQNLVYYPPEFVDVQTVLGISRHELNMKTISIDLLGQEFQPKRKSIMQRGKKSTYQGKSGKILKVEILRGVFMEYKDILPSIDLARSERPVSFLSKNVEFNNTAFAMTIK